MERDSEARHHRQHSLYRSDPEKQAARNTWDSFESSKSDDSYEYDEKNAPKYADEYDEKHAPKYPDNARVSTRRTYDDYDEYDDYEALEKIKARRRRERRYRRRRERERKRRRILYGCLGATLLLILIIVVAVVVALKNKKYDYKPSFAHVTNAHAFKSGGATHNSVNDTSDGIGAGQDEYRYYSGSASEFPPSTSWVSFADMWRNNLNTMQNSCEWLDAGKNNSPEVIVDIFNAIQSRANASLVDHRFILAIILQESNGCVRVGSTTSSGGVNNPGLMQSHNGHEYSSSHSELSIMAMVQDGTQGTEHGAGLVQNLNRYGNPYSAARGYNSGYIPRNGNLSEAAGATACYVSDVANRLTGWVNAKSSCSG